MYSNKKKTDTNIPQQISIMHKTMNNKISIEYKLK